MRSIELRHYETKEYRIATSFDKIHIKLEVLCDSVQDVYIKYWKRFFEHDSIILEMNNFSVNKISRFFDIELEFSETIRYLNYYFIIKTVEKTYFYSVNDLTEDEPNKSFELQYVNLGDIYTVPKWAEGRVGYQIFPDRFYRSKAKNAISWNELPDRKKIYGGDLQGITHKLDYLKDLGIKTLILLPIFEAYSNHKYDTINYFKIDPNYGTKNDLIELIKKAHSYDMKIILDGVFNHIGYFSSQFQDVIKNQEKSNYYDWFFINGEKLDTDEFNYLAVGDYKWMPKLNYKSSGLREYIKDVASYWIKEVNIDGWRFDVYDEIDESFRIELLRYLKQVKPDILFIAETWHEGTLYLNNNEVHSVMNYLLRDNIINYFVNGTLNHSEFQKRIELLMFRYPKQSHNVIYNLLGSHDTKRIFTLVKEDIKKLELMYAFLMTIPGMPIIYYGDEVGMKGENDPDCRRTMNWEEIGNEVYQIVKKLISIRNNSEVLQYGSFKHVVINDYLYSFIRELDNRKLLIVFNNNDFDVNIDLQNYSKIKSKSYLIIEI